MQVIIDIPDYARDMAVAKLQYLATTPDDEKAVLTAANKCEQQPVNLDLSDIDPTTIVDALANMAFSAIIQKQKIKGGHI